MKRKFAFIALSLTLGFSCAQAQPVSISSIKTGEEYYYKEFDTKSKSQACGKINNYSNDHISAAVSMVYPNGLTYQKLWDRGNGKFTNTNLFNDDCSVLLKIKGSIDGNSYDTIISCGVERLRLGSDKKITVTAVRNCRAI